MKAMHPSIAGSLFRKGPLRLALALFSALAVAGCLDGRDRVAGGSVTTNGLAGRVVQDGAPVRGAFVALYPESHDPFRDGAPSLDTTDSEGRYGFPDLGPGAYQLIASHPEGRVAALLAGVRIHSDQDSLLMAPVAELRPMATFRIHLPVDIQEPSGYLYLPGTGLGARIDSAALKTRVTVITGVPPGLYGSLHYVPPAGSSARNLLPGRTALEAGATHEVKPAALWKQALRIRVDASTAGVGTMEELAGFPLLVRLDGSVFDFAAAAPGGEDVRVTRSDSLTPLAFRIASWDAGSGRADLWVRLDSLSGEGTRIDLRLFSGPAPGATLPSADSEVFDTASGFLGVWGFDGGEESALPNLQDASGHARHASASPGIQADALASGGVGSGLRLDGRDDHLGFGPSSQYLPQPGGPITLSAWIRPDSIAQGDSIRHRILSLKTDSPDTSALAWGLASRGTLAHYSRSSDSVFLWNTVLSPGGLHHVALVVDGGRFTGYVDGREDFSADTENVGAAGARAALMGAHLPGNRNFHGLLDEVRMEGRNRNAAWIRLSFETQRPDADIVDVARLKGP